MIASPGLSSDGCCTFQKPAERLFQRLLCTQVTDQSAIDPDPGRVMTAGAPEYAHQQPVKQGFSGRQECAMNNLQPTGKRIGQGKWQVDDQAPPADRLAKTPDEGRPSHIFSIPDVVSLPPRPFRPRRPHHVIDEMIDEEQAGIDLAAIDVSITPERKASPIRMMNGLPGPMTFVGRRMV